MVAVGMHFTAVQVHSQHGSKTSLGKSQIFAGRVFPTTKKGRAPCPSVQGTTIRCSATPASSLGPDLWNDTYYPKGADAAAVHKRWYIIDAEGQTLGRLACLAAGAIRGKNNVGYTPSMDMGSFVIIVNAEKVAVTGKKETNKTYFRHTNGRPGGWRLETLRDLRARIPERIIEKAVRGMLPKGRLGNQLFTHLKVYKGPNHPHEAQRPENITSQISIKASEARS